ncbi:MAG: tRNA (adenosine(37)-N6)-threonylcarbamoyltransferase complex dimerization subunit type 1 TsaB [Bacteroidales bacterium]|nr:tRNA (adenosine(37)-N6)-threonylcarbamoyltransferase complex dimerization subunit type 1 TsaB [Bacteroidales bacterium]
MCRLILIETSTSLCSTALAENGRIICSRRSSEPRAHASLTAVFVKEMMDEAGWTAPDAVAVSMGPGSYTGLRVGVSTAKGLCFGWKVPLIAISTLDILARQAIEAGLPDGCAGILPMVDARRMEVYTAPYTPTGQRLGDIAPVVLDPDSFSDLFASGPIVVIGDAADKFRMLKGATGASPEAGLPCADGFVQACPEAAAMLVPAMQKYAKKEFEDIAYFEPFYLKQFIATTPKKLF